MASSWCDTCAVAPGCHRSAALGVQLLHLLVHCTALHCTALHCTALHCTALHCTALHCTALHCTALHCTTPHRTALHRPHRTPKYPQPHHAPHPTPPHGSYENNATLLHGRDEITKRFALLPMTTTRVTVEYEKPVVLGATTSA
jgi:hypothetical protein